MDYFLLTLTLIAIYAISAVFYYDYKHKAHSKGGIWESISPKVSDMYFCFIPLLNTILVIKYYLTSSPITDDKSKAEQLDKFFNLKK